VTDIDVRPKPRGIHYVTIGDDPIVMDTDDRGVMLSVSVDLALRFRTRAAFEAWLMAVLKQGTNP
jgi:hypothetical protein